MTAPTQPTPAALALDALARTLAARNPDAAQELARRLAHHAQQRKRTQRVPAGLGIAIRVNAVTMQLEMQAGEG